jgi:preprotein translocase subunit SecY
LKTNKLRCKITITFFLLLIYRLVTYIPLPGVSFINIIDQSTKGIIQIIYAFTGLNFSRASIISLGIMPYISSSIFIQFISFSFPFVSLINRKINFITRWLTIIICLFQAPIYLITMTSQFLPFFYMPKAYILDISNYKNKFFFF